MDGEKCHRKTHENYGKPVRFLTMPRDKLFYLDSNVPKVIHKLTYDLIIPEFKKLTNYLTDSKIAITSNKIENCFLKNFPKHIKII